MKEKTTAIVLAAGQGKRMHSKIQKQFLEIQGHPVLYYSLKCFQESPLIHDIIIVTGEDMISYCKREIVERYQLTKVSAVIAGGKERYDSVYKGLLACEECKYVFIHDGARPFLDEEIIKRNIQAVREYQACVAGMPVKDTIKVSDLDIAKNDKLDIQTELDTPIVSIIVSRNEASDEEEEEETEE